MARLPVGTARVRLTGFCMSNTLFCVWGLRTPLEGKRLPSGSMQKAVFW